MEASRFRPTDTIEPYDSLIANICWDDDEDKEAALAGGVYVTCGGIWKREENNQWRYWEDSAVADELNFNNGYSRRTQMTWFDLINNAICVGFAVLAFPVGPLLICWGSGPRPGERGERDWGGA